MKKFKILVSIICSFFISISALAAFEVDSKMDPKDVAKDNVKRAIKYYTDNGKSKDKLYQAINNTSGDFVSKNKVYYIFVLNDDAVNIARGDGDFKLIGKNRMNETDMNGKFYIKEMIEKAKKEGSGFITYMRKHPVTKEQETKTTYFERIDGMILCCGAYYGK